MITLERLKEILSYDPETGLWTRLVSRGAMQAGDIAGCLDEGYVRLRVDGKIYRSSRLAWFYMTGVWPPAEVDHIDRDRANDRWANLRIATRSQNNCNRGVFSNNQIGVKGISRHDRPRLKPFKASIKVNSRSKSIGYFETVDLASAAYEAAARENFGEFAAEKQPLTSDGETKA